MPISYSIMLETVAHNPRSNIETINVANEHFNGKLSGKCHRFAMLSANCFVIIPNQYRQRPCPGVANTAWCCRQEDGKRCASSDVQIHATVVREILQGFLGDRCSLPNHAVACWYCRRPCIAMWRPYPSWWKIVLCLELKFNWKLKQLNLKWIVLWCWSFRSGRSFVVIAANQQRFLPPTSSLHPVFRMSASRFPWCRSNCLMVALFICICLNCL